MKTIDKLIIKAKRKDGIDKLSIGFIYPSDKEPGKWIARGDIWNGIPGSSVKPIIFSCDSIEDAEKVLQDLGNKYPNNKDVVVFINDLTDD